MKVQRFRAHLRKRVLIIRFNPIQSLQFIDLRRTGFRCVDAYSDEADNDSDLMPIVIPG